MATGLRPRPATISERGATASGSARPVANGSRRVRLPKSDGSFGPWRDVPADVRDDYTDDDAQADDAQADNERQAPAKKPAPASSGARMSLPGAVNDGSGVVLGLVFWCWVALPYLRGGTPELRRVLKAKFLNKAPDGSWLP